MRGRGRVPASQLLPRGSTVVCALATCAAVSSCQVVPAKTVGEVALPSCCSHVPLLLLLSLDLLFPSFLCFLPGGTSQDRRGGDQGPRRPLPAGLRGGVGGQARLHVRDGDQPPQPGGQGRNTMGLGVTSFHQDVGGQARLHVRVGHINHPNQVGQGLARGSAVILGPLSHLRQPTSLPRRALASPNLYPCSFPCTLILAACGVQYHEESRKALLAAGRRSAPLLACLACSALLPLSGAVL